MSSQTTPVVLTSLEGEDNAEGITIKEEAVPTNGTNEVDEEEVLTDGTNEAGIDDGYNDGWDQLMGENLTMKIIIERKTGMCEEAVNTDEVPNTNSNDACEKELPELGDAVRVDFEGYCCTSDGNDNYESLLSSLEESIKSEHNEAARPDPTNDESTTPAPLLPTPFLTAKGWIVILGDKDVIPGLELAIRYLPLGASALVRCHSKFAYGLSGRRFGGGDDGTGYAVPPDSETIYRLTMHSITSAEELMADKSFQIACARQKKLIGNDCYKHEWQKLDAGGDGKRKALKAYDSGKDLMIGLIQNIDKDGAQCVDKEEVTDGNDSPNNSLSQSVLTIIRKEAVEVLLDCLNNTAAVYLQAKSYSKAKDAAAQAIQYDGNNMKALCRAAKAAMLDPAASFTESEMAITCAEEIDRDNREVKTLRSQLERTRKEYRQREKAMYARMMQGSADNNTEQKDPTDRRWALYISFYITFLLALAFWVAMKDQQPTHATNIHNDL